MSESLQRNGCASVLCQISDVINCPEMIKQDEEVKDNNKGAVFGVFERKLLLLFRPFTVFLSLVT